MIKLKDVPNKIPIKPGCYLFKNKKEKVIYVGKANNLKKRVSSYFQKKSLDSKTKSLVSKIEFIEFFITNNEVEALILENNLIKKYQPKYNIQLKDSKRYAYIHITKEDFSRILIVRKKIGTGEFFGPFTSAGTRDYLMHTLIKTFKLRTCKKISKKSCLRYHIKLCEAPCIKNISKKEYAKKISATKMVLKGKINDLLKILQKNMELYSKKQDFELAIELRNQIQSLIWLKEKQTMELQKKYNQDIINYKRAQGKVYLLLFNVYKGLLENKQEFEFEEQNDFFEQFISQYYSENKVPKEIILPKNISNSLKSFLEFQRKEKVLVVVPKKGDKKKLLELVLKNIEALFFGEVEKLSVLKTKLRLQETPFVIECFDVSHISGTSTVASMIQFQNGKPNKENYRRYKIRTVEGIDDFKAISEVVMRRYKRLLDEKKPLPNLIVVDGGKGQLSFALEELKNLNLKIPIISIAKKEEEIFVPGLKFSIKLEKKNKGLLFLREIRDEAHRFAISYNRLLRRKETLQK
ncbi:MAG: excinuclease ABC subunit UvrC [Nanoarchaeota archaeon]|nr:excinuclease ABC subunit UvrC [Nanoarchaeota archaeon]MBU1030061.1 excinuclease ABC subunit UvrC [Nanoarchaeota archaeon]MBU1850638.1 excinuclease ABC subunit UvrC [Nanoarchaeota archaeon]